MSTKLEIAANGFNVLSIVLATCNSVHTWWSGIVACTLFGALFFQTQLYADVTLQGFFIATSVCGWWVWMRGYQGGETPIQTTAPANLFAYFVLASACAAGYGLLLHAYTDAYAPYADSIVLTFSVLAQLLLMRRRIETWWCWLLVNSIAVPLYASRGLTLTAVLYACFWVNAVVALVSWRRRLTADTVVAVP